MTTGNGVSGRNARAPLSIRGAEISVRSVSKRFQVPDKGGFFTALDDITLDIRPGEAISIIGASGCGKTTLLRMMSGLTPCDDGSVTIGGKLVISIPDNVGFVFQEPSLLPWRTLRDNLRFVLRHYRLSKAEEAARIEEQLRLTHLAEFASYYPRTLSGGMQQRAGLARALVCNPAVLFMDEPLSALDAFTRRRLQEEISDIVSHTEATTILVTHDVDEAIFFSDRIVVMSSSPGRIREILDVDIERPRIHSQLLGNAKIAQLRDAVLSLVLNE